MILALRTDKKDAELYLFDGNTQVDIITWFAHRELSITLLDKIEQILSKHSAQLNDLTGLAVYKGPGSFTGLRIGITVANTLAYSLDIPVAGAEGEGWLQQSIEILKNDPQKSPVVPAYGADVTITKQKK